MTELKITATDMILRGAEAPAPIVDRRLDGRLLVAAPGKKNRWIVLDQAIVPAALAKRIKAPAKCVEERIVVPVEIVDAVIAQVEEWLVGGGQEQDAKRAAAAAKAAATRKAKAEAKAAAEREAKWIAEAPAREAAAAARTEAERARQAQWAEERRARELAVAAQRRVEDARMAQLRANRAQFPVTDAPAVGDAFEVEGDGMWRSDRVLICESLGRSWVQSGVAVCYAYGRPATAEEAAAYHADRPRSGHVVLRSDRAPAPGDRFKLRDGAKVVTTAVGRPYRVDDSLDQDYTSFYSSELWEQIVVRVDYEYPEAPAAAQPAQLQQPVQQQQACAAPVGPAPLSRDELLVRIRKADGQYAEVAAEIERKEGVNGPSRLDAWLLDGPRASGAELRAQLAELDRVAMKNPPIRGYRVVKAWVDDADVFQTLSFPLVFERAEDATGEIVSLLGGRDPALFSAAEREAGALLTMEEVGPATTPQPVHEIPCA